MADRRGRVQAIELLRILAAFGIVAYHAQAPFHDVAYSGLIVFLVLSPMLDVQRNWERRRPVSLLAKTFLVPWAFWMAIYGSFNYASDQPILPNGWLGILYGTSAHLWFLPFMFFVAIGINSVKPYSAKFVFWISLVLATYVLIEVAVWRPWSLALPVPLPQWAHAVAPVLVGIALGSMNRVQGGWKVLLVLLGSALIVASYDGLRGIGIPYTIGILSVVVSTFYIPRIMPISWNVQMVADCMMGVYLSHFLVLVIVTAITGKLDYITVAVTFCAVTFLVWIIRLKFPSSKLLLG